MEHSIRELCSVLGPDCFGDIFRKTACGLASGNAPSETGGTKQGLMTREEGMSRSTVKKRDLRDWLWGGRTLQHER